MNVSVRYVADEDGGNPRIVGLETSIGTLGDAHMDALAAVYYLRDPKTRMRSIVAALLGNLERAGLVRLSDAARDDESYGLVRMRRSVRNMRPTPLGARIARQL